MGTNHCDQKYKLLSSLTTTPEASMTASGSSVPSREASQSHHDNSDQNYPYISTETSEGNISSVTLDDFMEEETSDSPKLEKTLNSIVLTIQ